MNRDESIVITTEVPMPRQASTAGRANGLTAAAVVIVGVGLWFADYARSTPPAPGNAVGLTLGIVGFTFMLGAETLYTLRKRVRGFSRGRLSTWLHVHIFLGLIGAFLVVLHGSGKYHGPAGVAVGVTAVMILSGFVGRYLYTAAPRTLDGAEIDARELPARFARVERGLRELRVRIAPHELAALSLRADLPDWWAVVGRALLLRSQRSRARRFVRRMPIDDNAKAAELRRLLIERYELQLEIRSVVAARRWLAWWHVLHVPLGWVLFTLATIHIAAAWHYTRG